MDNSQLSKREKEVATFLSRGRSNKQIALELGISNRTVEFHLRNIYAKLGVNSRTEAILKLTAPHLAESTGASVSEIPVDSTVVETGVSTENGIEPIFRRNLMKKSYYWIGGIVLAIAILATIIIDRQPTANLALTPTAALMMTSTVEVPALSVETPTVTLPAATPMPQPTQVTIQPQTVNGYTVVIDSYYIDVSHVSFQLRLLQGEKPLGHEYLPLSWDIFDEYGNLINASVGMAPALDSEHLQLDFVPVKLLRGDRLKGYLAFELVNNSAFDKTLAKFRFDFDLPIYEESIFNPKQYATANGMEMLLDQVTITPAFTQFYLCYPFEGWSLSADSVLQLDGQEAKPYGFRGLYDSATGGEVTAGSEPYWSPPIKHGACSKIRFALGTANPTSLILTIPELEKFIPDMFFSQDLATAYPNLNHQQAYHQYLVENDGISKGPWIFRVDLSP